MACATLRLSSSLKSFQYQLLPSAFKIAESPTYVCWRTFHFSLGLWNRNSANNSEQFKNRTLAVLLGTSSYLGGAVALPLTLCLTPVTLMADIVVGVVECIFCAYKGLGKEDISIIAHRKFVISPCQHLTFCLGAIAGLGAAYACLLVSSYTLSMSFGLKGSLMFWSLGYAFGQKAVGLLPKNLNHHSLNIFIGGGSGEGIDGQEKWLDSKSRNIRPQSRPKPPPSFKKKDNRSVGNYSPEWNAFINKEIVFIRNINDANVRVEYKNFKQRLLDKCNPQDLLELPNNFDQASLRRKYRSLALILHPDKNHPRQREATALFRVLQKAYEILKR